MYLKYHYVNKHNIYSKTWGTNYNITWVKPDKKTQIQIRKILDLGHANKSCPN